VIHRAGQSTRRPLRRFRVDVDLKVYGGTESANVDFAGKKKSAVGLSASVVAIFDEGSSGFKVVLNA
jgi:hypothetical protein